MNKNSLNSRSEICITSRGRMNMVMRYVGSRRKHGFLFELAQNADRREKPTLIYRWRLLRRVFHWRLTQLLQYRKEIYAFNF